jgi:hypothetical protein
VGLVRQDDLVLADRSDAGVDGRHGEEGKPPTVEGHEVDVPEGLRRLADREVDVLHQRRGQVTRGVGLEDPLGQRGEGGAVTERGEVAPLEHLDVDVAPGDDPVAVGGEQVGRPGTVEVGERPLRAELELVDRDRLAIAARRLIQQQLALALVERSGERRVAFPAEDRPHRGPSSRRFDDAVVAEHAEPGPPQLGDVAVGHRPGGRQEPARGRSGAGRREHQRGRDLDGGHLGRWLPLARSPVGPAVEVEGEGGEVEDGRHRERGAWRDREAHPGRCRLALAPHGGRRRVVLGDGRLDRVLRTEGHDQTDRRAAAPRDDRAGRRVDLTVDELEAEADLVVRPDERAERGAFGRQGWKRLEQGPRRARLERWSGVGRCGLGFHLSHLESAALAGR